MKEREILFENRYEVDRELYDRWRRLGLVQSRGALFFRFVWAGLLVLVTADFFRNLFFGAGFSVVLLILIALCVYRIFLLPRVRSNTMVRYMIQRAGKERWQRAVRFGAEHFELEENGTSMEFTYDQISRLAQKEGWMALIMYQSGAVYLKRDGFVKGSAEEFDAFLAQKREEAKG